MLLASLDSLAGMKEWYSAHTCCSRQSSFLAYIDAVLHVEP
jgi:hypothetical protein